MTLAPITLFVYNRPDHTKQTIEALQKNELAKESELFIYSDEAKNDDARKSVGEVRKYIEKVDSFKKVTIVKREQNWGLADSIIDGATKIVNKHIMIKNSYGDEFGIGSDEAFNIIEVAKMYGGKLEMLPERRGNRMTAEVMTAKTEELGWKAERKLQDYIEECRKNAWR